MRKLLPSIIGGGIILVLIVGGIFYYQNNKSLQEEIYRKMYPSFCDVPISYRIGSVDKEFEIEKSEFANFTKQAAEIWNKSYGETLFVEDPNARLSVNLVYDERQRLTNQISTMSEEISDSESGLKPNIEKHKQEVEAFNEKMRDFNERVKYWNERGGAPEDDYNKLTREQEELKAEADKLNAKAVELNQSTVEFNSQIGNYNETVSKFNDTLKERPEEGLYDGQKQMISIYFYINNPELVHTLAHEFGHALGITHVDSKDSLMHSRTNQSTKLSEDDLAELEKVCLRQPIWEILRDRYFQSSK